MRLPELEDHLRREVDVPADRDAVVDAIGHLAIDAPDGERESVREVLVRTDAGPFGSADAAYTTLLSCLGEQHVGRRRYDDRGHNVVSNDRSF